MTWCDDSLVAPGDIMATLTGIPEAKELVPKWRQFFLR